MAHKCGEKRQILRPEEIGRSGDKSLSVTKNSNDSANPLNGNFDAVSSSSKSSRQVIYNRLSVKLVGHTEEVNRIVFSPNEQFVATASDDGTVRIWNVFDGRLIAKLVADSGEMLSFAFSPDGRTIVTTSQKTAQIWCASNGAIIANYQGTRIS